ncbi:MAG: nitroreductase family protein [Arenicella sp.]|jgi:nitroreductase|nr:nitroreductase family protein [Arenicella sp.]HAU67073.1 nitroreductase family protein [Gammaproteobacteria bacterium]
MSQKKLNFSELDSTQMLQNSSAFYHHMKTRRTVRNFSDRAVDPKILRNAIRTAGTAPSGANKQPWHFVLISDQKVKHEIRVAAEKEEHEFYTSRAPKAWLDDLEVFDTDQHKPFLETAPHLVAIFLERNTVDAEGIKHKNYYMPESVGIATGFLLAALHNAGLVTLTHTPSPMKFLNQILERPTNEKPYMLIVVGYPADGATVPDISRKEYDEIATEF